MDEIMKKAALEMIERDLEEKESIHSMIVKVGKRQVVLIWTMRLSIIAFVICSYITYNATLNNRKIGRGMIIENKRGFQHLDTLAHKFDSLLNKKFK